MAVTTPAPALRTPVAESPLTAAYTRLTEVLPALRISEVSSGQKLPRDGGWVGADELAVGGQALDTFLAWNNAKVLRDHGRRARPDVIASFGLHRYAWPATLLITIPWFLHRRVPRFPVNTVAFNRASGRFAVRTGAFACLPGDPAAGLPGACVVADEEALRTEVREAVAEHLGPVLDGFRPRMRRGRRALWGSAGDEIVEGLWHVGQLLGEDEERRALAEAERLLPGAVAPYPKGAGFRELTGPDGAPLATRDRASCCLFYTLRPDDTCGTCPRTCDSDRVERFISSR